MRSKYRSRTTTDASQARKELEKAAEVARSAWEALAQAGDPRCPRAYRARYVQQAVDLLDAARAAFARGRCAFADLAGRVEEKARSRDRYYQAAPHEKGAVTSLQPECDRLSAELRRLTRCALSHRGGARAEAMPPRRKAEHEQAVSFQPFFGMSELECMACAWCSAQEEGYRRHYALCEAGFLVDRRERARRFVCWRCFGDARDLIEPAPPLRNALPPPVETTCDAVASVPLLPAMAAAGPGGGEVS